MIDMSQGPIPINKYYCIQMSHDSQIKVEFELSPAKRVAVELSP